MSNAKLDAISSLITSLSKSEKRHFKLYANRITNSKDSLYIQLFNHIEYAPNHKDAQVKNKLKFKNTSQYVNTKRHLYRQILKSLRLLYSKKHAQIAVNEEIDYATILAHKNLYHDSYEYLERLDLPLNEHYTQNLLTVTELKRRIASNIQLTTNDYDNIIGQTRVQLEIDWEIDDLFNELKKDFALLGYTRNEREKTLRQERFLNKINSFQYKKLSKLQQYNFHTLKILYFKNTCNYREVYRNALHQFELLSAIPYHKNEGHHINLTVNCIKQILEVCYINKNKNKFNKWHSVLTAKIDLYNTTKDKHGGTIIELEEYLFLYNYIINDNYKCQIDNLYKPFEQNLHLQLLRSQYLANQGKLLEALDIINKLLNLKNIPGELALYARLHQVLFHYRLYHFELVKNLLPQLRLAFKTSGHFNKTISAVLTTTSKGVKALDFGMKDEINELLEKLKVYSKTTFENIPFLYFDFYNWFEAVKLNINVSELNKQT